MHSRSPCKLFIGGLDPSTSSESLHKYFSTFGDLTECEVVRDHVTDKSKCFGFIEFSDPSSVEDVMAQEHVLDGKTVGPRLAIAREDQANPSKIYIKGFPFDTDESELLDLFSCFGQVADVYLVPTPEGSLRGFGFMTFATAKSAETAIAMNFLKLRDSE
ncbi:hypothetical protein BGZ83_001066, partial [Gryganskiella cystojenkinii]